MTVPWIYRGFGILIAVEDDTANVQSVIKPFQWPVNPKTNYLRSKRERRVQFFFVPNDISQIWVGLVISTVCVIVVLKLLQRYLNHRSSLKTENTGNQYLYVFGNLLSQGLIQPQNIKKILVRYRALYKNRISLHIKPPIVSTCRWRLEPGRFYLRPSVHFDSLHLRSDANQSSASSFCPRHP